MIKYCEQLWMTPSFYAIQAKIPRTTY
jgi:hypothetical protein